MAIEPTILMQKAVEGSAVKSLLGDFGFAVTSVEWPSVEPKELASRDWPHADGTDVYFPPGGLKLKSIDIKAGIVCKAESGVGGKLEKLLDYLFGLDGSGVETAVYFPYGQKGYAHAYCLKVEKPAFNYSDTDECLDAAVVFRVTDPTESKTLFYNVADNG